MPVTLREVRRDIARMAKLLEKQAAGRPYDPVYSMLLSLDNRVSALEAVLPAAALDPSTEVNPNDA